MRVEMKPIDWVKPYENNPRQNAKAVPAVVESLRRYGFRQPIVTDAKGVIVVGHTRYLAAKELGLTEVPVHIATDLSPDLAREYRIADNKTAEGATWDAKLLPIELSAGITSGADWGAMGFGALELGRLLSPSLTAREGAEPDDAPDLPATPRTRPGDLYRLGEHVLVCGDSAKDAPAQLLGDDRPVMVLTDPPYGVEYEGKTKDALTIENDGIDQLRPLLESTLGRLVERTAPGCVWYVCAPAGPQFAAFAAVLGEAGVWRQTLVWVKDSMVLGRSDHHYRHEAILYGWTPGGAHHAPPTRSRTSVLEFPRPKRSEVHPTMKPVALFADLLSVSSDAGDLVLDPFCGSGTTIIACEQLQRRCRAIELDPGYCDVIVERWERFTGRKAELIRMTTKKAATRAKATRRAGGAKRQAAS